MKINVIGLGYVGLPTAIMISSTNRNVIGTDSNIQLLDNLRNDNYINDDPDLNRIFYENKGKNLFFESSVVKADYHFIAVPTPFNKLTKKVDLTHIRNVLDDILALDQLLFKIVIESTVSPGSIEQLKKDYSLKNSNLILIHAPERILPGNTFNELINNDRVIGSDENVFVNELAVIYKDFIKGDIYITDIKTAELSKVVENSYRDVNIAFANELAMICNELNIEVNELIRICNKHPRVNILNPGPGVGGHCIPVDPWFLVGDFPQLTNLILSARNTNDSMPLYIAKRILDISKVYGVSLNKIGIYGLTYKPNVADFRESPSFKVIENIQINTGRLLKSFDPYFTNDETKSFSEFINSIELLVILVGHKQIYEQVDQLKNKLVFDVVNILPQNNVIKL
jgi:UDP-N-acetyl-D-mannosaminuronic acid dehydrogenase